MKSIRTILAMFSLFACANAYADGYMFKGGRFPEGKVTLLTLTAEQKQLIELYNRCRDNRYTPYGGPGFLGHEIVLNLVTKENEHGKGWKPPWCSGGRA
jgi:hypothetical protein